MKDLIERSYKAIIERGLINTYTRPNDFLDKMNEELWEVFNVVYGPDNIAPYLDERDYIEEVTDLATVCIMQIHHLGYDFIEEFKKVVEKNEAIAKKTLSK